MKGSVEIKRRGAGVHNSYHIDESGTAVATKPPSITILGFDYPDDEIRDLNAHDSEPPIQTQLFARRLTKAIRAGFVEQIHCISAAPTSEFPRSHKLWIPGVSRQAHSGAGERVTIEGVAYVNHRLLKIVTRTFTTACAAARRAYHQQNGLVIIYSVHVPFMAVGIALAKLTRSTAIGVWTDPPAVPLRADNTGLRRIFRKVEHSIAVKLMRSMNLSIPMTERLAVDFAPKVPYLLMEALSDEDDRPEPIYRSGGSTVFVYTGSISRRYGVDRLVAAARSIPAHHNVTLQLYGDGDYASDLLMETSGLEHVRYLGSVKNDEALLAQTDADFLINARDPGDDYTAYSFPSKTLEYLGSGVPVISTQLVGIPSEYWACVIALSDNSTRVIAEAMVRASQLSAGERRAIGRMGRRLARTKTYITQGEKIPLFVAAWLRGEHA